MILEFELGAKLPEIKFGPRAIRLLNAFDKPPTNLLIGPKEYLFTWDDGQECYPTGDYFGPISFNYHRAQTAPQIENLERYWDFKSGVGLEDDVRKRIRSMHDARHMHNDLLVNPSTTISRYKEDNGENYVDFENNATRPMRFERRAFLDMIKIATEIDFTCSPVCFLHEHGRGMIVERTLGTNFEAADV